MSWIEYKNMPPKRVYRSSEVSENEIVRDLSILMTECVNNKEKDFASDCNSILFFTNATNWYLDLYFVDLESMEPKGHSQYTLELHALVEKYNADEFNAITKKCCILFLQTEFGQKLKENIEFSLMDDSMMW